MNNTYLKYSGMAFQMAATIGIFTFIGWKLDAHFLTSKPYYTIGLSLVGVAISLIQVFRDFLKPGK